MKKCLIIGNMNAVTYKEIFPLIRDNKMWWGCSTSGSARNMWFRCPSEYVAEIKNANYKEEDGKKYRQVQGIEWFTNLPHGKRHEPLDLFKTYNPKDYPKYDNYDAIEVSKVADIPYDYTGIMGVPISFLNSYCPDQFEIIGLATGNSSINNFGAAAGYVKDSNDRGGCGVINGKRTYARILIRFK